MSHHRSTPSPLLLAFLVAVAGEARGSDPVKPALNAGDVLDRSN